MFSQSLWSSCTSISSSVKWYEYLLHWVVVRIKWIKTCKIFRTVPCTKWMLKKCCWYYFLKNTWGTYLMVQWLRLHASMAGGVGLIFNQETEIWHTVWCNKKVKKKRKEKRVYGEKKGKKIFIEYPLCSEFLTADWWEAGLPSANTCWCPSFSKLLRDIILLDGPGILKWINILFTKLLVSQFTSPTTSYKITKHLSIFSLLARSALFSETAQFCLQVFVIP